MQVFIDGAAGTTGLEIAERLQGRSEFSLIVLDDDRRKDTVARREALNECDVAILCLPDDAAREAVALIDNDTTRVIDASSAHRVADGWTYGFPELVGREAVARARFVSNPGCYPTGFLGLVAPLVRAGLLPADWPFTINAVSGYSGGGKALIERYEADGAPAFRAYGYELAHKHLPEMKAHAGLAHPVIFAPAVVPAYRGMIVEVPLHLGAMSGDPTADNLREALATFYADSRIVTVHPQEPVGELLLDVDTAPHDGMELFVFGNAGGWHARLVARLDNLGKGASGAAVQNLNLMAGLEETAGLRL
ncbi:N-acetyl-gamma-glutamyl-phosphate reductase [Alteriqipengyuania sp. WL0013]|uniref:N-acetyl-gamma-glutamyl-phosphate reductase n=1 Tax=Alteriqipengyuania sp. WL0013 TaxID=3110773 RepID=UPI002C7710D6|nr:N-acetyl-gamma-glutamyl-phosphate reductase [Alteriqipengyuania sp. WL0013]MEB3415819.1 N-acetyl-gamma-glutamyl-phosphate reductase [Alteriqipengyuania sp. WL0013]